MEGPDATQSDAAAEQTEIGFTYSSVEPQSWDNENSPPQAVDSFSEFSGSYDDMISLKRVLASDTVQVCRRIDWVSQNKLLVDLVSLMTCIVMIIL